MQVAFSNSDNLLYSASQYFSNAFQLNRVSLHHAVQGGGELHEGLGYVGHDEAWDWKVNYCVVFQLTIKLLMNVYLGFRRAVGQRYTRNFENRNIRSSLEIVCRHRKLTSYTENLIRSI